MQNLISNFQLLTHPLRRHQSVGHLWWLSRHAYSPCRSWFQLVFVRYPDTEDQHMSWLVFQHLFCHAYLVLWKPICSCSFTVCISLLLICDLCDFGIKFDMIWYDMIWYDMSYFVLLHTERLHPILNWNSFWEKWIRHEKKWRKNK